MMKTWAGLAVSRAGFPDSGARAKLYLHEYCPRGSGAGGVCMAVLHQNGPGHWVVHSVGLLGGAREE